MNINYKQPQFELFPANSATLEDVNKPKFLLANLTLSIESLVILAILGIMVALFSFSLGVERGKHLAAQALDERVSAAWNLAPRKPMMAAVALPQALPARQMVTARGNGGYIARVVNPAPARQENAKVLSGAFTQTGHYTVQAATYKNEEYAKQEALKARATGFQSFLIKKGDFWLVCLGQFATPQIAENALKRVQSKYSGSSVRRF